eukprot:364405-Chlamydomonas_euryale.AAC.3
MERFQVTARHQLVVQVERFAMSILSSSMHHCRRHSKGRGTGSGPTRAEAAELRCTPLCARHRPRTGAKSGRYTRCAEYSSSGCSFLAELRKSRSVLPLSCTGEHCCLPVSQTVHASHRQPLAKQTDQTQLSRHLCPHLPPPHTNAS